MVIWKKIGFIWKIRKNAKRGLTRANLCDIMIGKKRIWLGRCRIGTELHIRYKAC